LNLFRGGGRGRVGAHQCSEKGDDDQGTKDHSKPHVARVRFK
jgi:hypothetical protein